MTQDVSFMFNGKPVTIKNNAQVPTQTQQPQQPCNQSIMQSQGGQTMFFSGGANAGAMFGLANPGIEQALKMPGFAGDFAFMGMMQALQMTPDIMIAQMFGAPYQQVQMQQTQQSGNCSGSEQAQAKPSAGDDEVTALQKQITSLNEQLAKLREAQAPEVKTDVPAPESKPETVPPAAKTAVAEPTVASPQAVVAAPAVVQEGAPVEFDPAKENQKPAPAKTNGAGKGKGSGKTHNKPAKPAQKPAQKPADEIDFKSYNSGIRGHKFAPKAIDKGEEGLNFMGQLSERQEKIEKERLAKYNSLDLTATIMGDLDNRYVAGRDASAVSVFDADKGYRKLNNSPFAR